MSWKIEPTPPVVGGRSYGGKDVEFARFVDLPRRTAERLEVGALRRRAAGASRRGRLAVIDGARRVGHAGRLPRLPRRARAASGRSRRTPTWRPAAAGSARAAPRIWRAAARPWCRTRASRRTCRRGRGCTPSRRPTRRWRRWPPCAPTMRAACEHARAVAERCFARGGRVCAPARRRGAVSDGARRARRLPRPQPARRLRLAGVAHYLLGLRALGHDVVVLRGHRALRARLRSRRQHLRAAVRLRHPRDGRLPRSPRPRGSLGVRRRRARRGAWPGGGTGPRRCSATPICWSTWPASTASRPSVGAAGPRSTSTSIRRSRR